MNKIVDRKLKVTVDLVTFTLINQELCLLAVKRKNPPFAHDWSLPSSKIDVDLDACLEQTAKRILTGLTGLQAAYLEQVQTLGNQHRDPRGWSVTVAYYGLVYGTFHLQKESMRWMTIPEAMDTRLAFDHAQIIENCLQRFQNKALYTSLPIFLLQSEFTLTELQKAYEVVLGFKMEKKSFRRRLLDAGFLKETGHFQRAKNRPAQLYCLSQQQPYFFPRIIEGVRQQNI